MRRKASLDLISIGNQPFTFGFQILSRVLRHLVKKLDASKGKMASPKVAICPIFTKHLHWKSTFKTPLQGIPWQRLLENPVERSPSSQAKETGNCKGEVLVEVEVQ